MLGKKSSQNSKKEAKEGKTYETAVALNPDTSVNQPTPRTFLIMSFMSVKS